MNLRTTYTLFGVLIGMLGLFGLMLALQATRHDFGYVFPSLHTAKNPVDTESIASIEIDKGSKKIVLVKAEGGWQLSQPRTRLDDFKISQLIREVIGARRDEEADVTSNLRQFGLDQPEEVVTLKQKGAGKEWQLNVGKLSADKKYVYVTSSDRPQEVMAVKKADVDGLFFKDLADLRSQRLLEVTATSAQAVRLKGEKHEVTLVHSDNGTWKFEKPAGYGTAEFEGDAANPEATAKHPGVKGLLDALGGLRVASEKDFVPLGDRPLASYGLDDNKESLRIEVKRTPDTLRSEGKSQLLTDTLLVGNEVKDKDKGDQYYVRLASDQGVARIDAKKLELVFKVLKDPAILRSYDLAQLDPNAPDAIDLLRGKDLQDVIKLRRPEATLWKVFTKNDIPRKANTTTIEGDKGLIATLQGKRQIKEFFSPQGEEEAKKLDAKLGLDQPVAEVKVWVGGIEKEEKKEAKKEKEKAKETKKDEKKAEKEAETEPKLKKDAKPAVTLLFGKTDKSLVYVKRVAADGSVSRMAVPVSILEKVAPSEGALAFLDSSVPGFRVANVTRLELVRGTEKFEADRDKESMPPKWILKEPKDLPGRTTADAGAVHEILDQLATLSAKKWIAKIDPKDQKELAKYGLDRPAVTVTVTIKKTGEDKGVPHGYKFGKDTDVARDKPGVYGIQGSSDLVVFLADPAVVKTLRDAELRDRSIFKFDPEKVKEIKVAIRKGNEGLRTPVFVRKPETKAWVIKSGLDEFSLDEDKVQALVVLLSDLHAEKYVSFKGPPKADYKLGEKEAALRIEVLMDDGKTKHELTVGAAKDKTGYYALSNALADVVFLVNYERFTPILGGVSYFSKNQAAE
jgi:Domain of unknown function (DUF4340)